MHKVSPLFLKAKHTHTHKQQQINIGINWKTKYTTMYEHFQNLCNKNILGRVWRYQRGNQNSYIEEEHTTQWRKEGQRDKKRSTKHRHKTQDRVTKSIPLTQIHEISLSWLGAGTLTNTRRLTFVAWYRHFNKYMTSHFRGLVQAL